MLQYIFAFGLVVISTNLVFFQKEKKRNSYIFFDVYKLKYFTPPGINLQILYTLLQVFVYFESAVFHDTLH